MARSVKGYSPVGVESLLSGQSPYTNEHIERIIKVAGGLPGGEIEYVEVGDELDALKTETVSRRVALERRLALTVCAWRIAAAEGSRPTHKQLVKSLEDISVAAARLLMALGGNDRKSIPAELYNALVRRAGVTARDFGGLPRYTGPGFLRQAIENVAMLKAWAVEAARSAADEGARPIGCDVELEAAPAMAVLVDGLTGIWVEVFGRKIKATYYSNQQTRGTQGPMINFLRACMEPLGIKPTNDGLRERVRKSSWYEKSPTRKREKPRQGETGKK